MNIKLVDVLENKIKSIIKEEYNQEIDGVIFEIPSDIKNGHLSTNVALKNSKILKVNPLESGEAIVKKLSAENFLDKVEVVKPGFINFYYSKQYFSELLKDLLKADSFDFENKNQNINVEYVSANPTGELHLGHARNASFGDSLANLLKRVGYNVTKEYYINDAGVQMQNLGKSVRAFYLENCGQELDFPEDGYKGNEIKRIADELYVQVQDEFLDSELEVFIDYGYKKNMEEIKKVMKKLNVTFDVFSSEKSYHDNGSVQEVIDVLKEKNEIYDEDGAWWLETSKYGDDKDRVLQKSDGTHTYLTSDIAYHKDKMERTNGLLINVWGGDHHGYVARVAAAMKSLGYPDENLEIILLQMVAVLENNEKVKMSKRKGTSVTIKDLLAIVDEDVLRYFFIMRSPDSQLDFDITLAQKQNSENPIFYIQYAHARICSLIEKAQIIIRDDFKIKVETVSDIDISLILLLNEYKNILEEASIIRRPHVIANYMYEVSSAFHKFYNAQKILETSEEIIEYKIAICLVTKKIIADGLMVLGINPKEKM